MGDADREDSPGREHHPGQQAADAGWGGEVEVFQVPASGLPVNRPAPRILLTDVPVVGHARGEGPGLVGVGQPRGNDVTASPACGRKGRDRRVSEVQGRRSPGAGGRRGALRRGRRPGVHGPTVGEAQAQLAFASQQLANVQRLRQRDKASATVPALRHDHDVGTQAGRSPRRAPCRCVPANRHPAPV